MRPTALCRACTFHFPSTMESNEYNEQNAIEAIRRTLGEIADRYDDDEILNVIDIIWDYYEDNGLLDPATALDNDEDPDTAEERELREITEHARRLLAKDEDSTIDPAHLPAIIKAEIDYENSLF